MSRFHFLLGSVPTLILIVAANGNLWAQGNQRIQSQQQFYVPPQNQTRQLQQQQQQQQQQLQKQQNVAPQRPRPEDILRLLVPPPDAESQPQESYRGDSEYMPQRDSTPSPLPIPTREEASRMSNEQLQRAVRRALATLDDELDGVQTGDSWRGHLELDAIACVSWQQPAMPFDSAMRERLGKIARKHGDVARQPNYASISRLAGFRALQATLPEYALGPVARSQRELQKDIATLEQALDRWSSAPQWKQHLQTQELRRMAGQGDLQRADSEKLRGLFKRYDDIAKDQQYAAVAQLMQFQAARQRLQQLIGYADKLTAPVASADLNPQPEPPSRGLNPQPEPPGKAVGLNPQPEPPSRGLNPQPEPPSRPDTLDPQPEQPGRGASDKKKLNPQPEPPG